MNIKPGAPLADRRPVLPRALDDARCRRDDLPVDPVTVIVSAVALGAAAGLKETATRAVKDAYAVLRKLISDRYQDVDVAPVEKRPDSAAKRESLEEDLAAAGAGRDGALLDAAQALITQVKAQDAAAAAAVGIDLARVEAAALRIRGVAAEGTGVQVRDGRFTGDIEISDVRSGKAPPDSP